MSDLRGLWTALEHATPSEAWQIIQELSEAALTPVEPAEDDRPQYLVACRSCHDEFWSPRKPTGSKWSTSCVSCLQHEI
jgi:hypothetical protein